jgi:hypothetical protein
MGLEGESTHDILYSLANTRFFRICGSTYTVAADATTPHTPKPQFCPPLILGAQVGAASSAEQGGAIPQILVLVKCRFRNMLRCLD